MKRCQLVVLFALVAFGAMAPTAGAKGFGMVGAATGVTVKGSPYRYVAIAPGRRDRLTVVERIDRRGGRVSRWWYLRGGYYVPAVAYDGSAGGLSADGSTLVLTQFPNYLLGTRTMRLAILRTGRVTRPAGWHHPRRWVRFVGLSGDFGFKAISPDGSTVFLTHYLDPRLPGARVGAEEIRTLDTATGRLAPAPVPPAEDEEPGGPGPGPRDATLPISSTTSPDGRWAYTLYGGYRGDGPAPFLEILDTGRRRPIRHVALPQLKSQRNPFLLEVRMEDRGTKLLVLKRPATPGPKPRPLLRVDPRTGNVEKATQPPVSSATASPWPAIGLGSAAALLGVAWATRRRRGASADGGGRV